MDLKLQPAAEHPHGSTDAEFHSLFTTDIDHFNFHLYAADPPPGHRQGHDNLRPAKEKGNINTLLGVMLNETSRHLVIDVIDRVPCLRHTPPT